MDKPTPMSFDDWINAIFNHVAAEEPWYITAENDDVDVWNLEFHYPEITVQYITKLFEEIAILPQRFSDEQIAQGLNYIVNPALSNIFSIVDNQENDVDRQTRLNCIAAIYNVYEQLFAVRCSPDLFTPREIHHPLDYLCFMWWDIYNVSRSTKNSSFTSLNAALNEAEFQVLSRVLKIDSEPCRTGALHGLNHIGDVDPKRAAAIIQAFIADNPHISPKLKAYAEKAIDGSLQ